MLEQSSLIEQLEGQRQKVDVEHFDMTVRELVRMAVDGELVRSPDYQRKFRWQDADESRLVESVFLGLPVPAIYVAANANGTWELVDGLQRVSSLIHYTTDDLDALEKIGKHHPLRLESLEKLGNFNQTCFADLPTPLQLAFFKRFVRVTSLSDKSDMDVRFDLFERLNTGGIALSPQEVRACVYQGKFATTLRDLAAGPRFSALLKLQAKRKDDGTPEEQVLKFFAYFEERQDFKGAVKRFLNNYMEKLAKDASGYEERARLFEQVVDILYSLNPGPLLRKGVHITPLNQFEAVMVAIAEEVKAGNNSPSPQERWLDDEELVDFSTGATNTKRMLDGRIERARQLLRGATVNPIRASTARQEEIDEVDLDE